MRAGEQSEARPQGEARRIKAYDPTAKGRQYSFSDDEEETPLLHLPAANTSFKPRRDILADATCCVFLVCLQTIPATHKLSLPKCFVLCVQPRASSGSGLLLLFQVGLRID